MKPVFLKTGSLLRKLVPTIQRLRKYAAKFDDRTAKRLLISGGPIPFLDATLIFPKDTGLIYSTPLFWDGGEAYERSTSLTLALLIEHSGAFFDIGSNIGIYSIYAGVKYPQVQTYAFEPVPKIWKKNIAFHRENSLPETNVMNAAVGDRDGVQQLILPICTEGVEEEQTGTLQADSWQKDQQTTETIDVRSVTLDAFTALIDLPEGMVTVKIDVENFEAAVFRGARAFIERRQPWIVCEILPRQKIDPVTLDRSNNNEEVVELISSLRYDIFALTDQGYFRMTTRDFYRPREFKDFLLTPPGKITREINYFSRSNLESYVAASKSC